MLAVDIVKQTSNIYEYDLNIAEGQGNLLNKYKPVNSFKNSKDETLFQAKNSFFRTYIETTESLTEKNSDIKNWLLPRAMHMIMLNHFKIKIVIPGDIELKVGDVINYEFPMFDAANKAGKKLDKRRSGKYLVSAVNHKFSEDVFESIVELVSDSFAESVPGAKDGLNKLTKKGR
jgi:hypothetical protein